MNVQQEVQHAIQQREITKARDAFFKDPAYLDLLTDPALFQQMDQRTAAIVRDNPGALSDPLNVMREAARQTQDWLSKVTGKSAVKRRAQTTTTRDGGPSLTEADQDKTRTFIEKMRELRGQ